MLKLKRLLLPVDYSPRCLDAADCVRAISTTRTDVEVTVLHVTDTRAQRRADADLIRALGERLSGSDVHFHEVAGDPAQRIIEHARTHETDLIVMPTRGRGFLGRFLLGSVTARVLGGVECPVWTGRLFERASDRPSRITSVACGIDLGPRSANVLRWAAGFADSFGARLTILHVNDQLVPATGVVHDPEWRFRVALELREQFSELLASTGVKAEVRLIAGAPTAAVRESVERLGADVLVIGRSPKGLAGRLCSSGFGIIRRSPCAVVSVDPAAKPHEARKAQEDPDGDLVAAGPPSPAAARDGVKGQLV